MKMVVYSESSCEGFFSIQNCQIQVLKSFTQHLLHPLHRQHHLQQLHVHHIHHLHNLLQFQSASSILHTQSICIMLFRQEFLHRSSYTGVFTEIVYTGVPIQEFLYRSHYTGVLPLMFLQRSFTQDLLQRSCSTGVVTQKLTSKWSTSETPCKAPTSQALLMFFLRQQGQPKTCLRNLTAEIVHVGCANVW